LISFAATSAGAADEMTEAPWVPDLGNGTIRAAGSAQRWGSFPQHLRVLRLT
jgi:hypothetical protein